ncbi:MAG: hypothetical protein AAB340_02885 [Patescibacteria group bacterium]
MKTIHQSHNLSVVIDEEVPYCVFICVGGETMCHMSEIVDSSGEHQLLFLQILPGFSLDKTDWTRGFTIKKE